MGWTSRSWSAAIYVLPPELKTFVAKVGQQEMISCMTEFIVAASVLQFTRERMKVSKGASTLRSCWYGQWVVEVGVSRALVPQLLAL